MSDNTNADRDNHFRQINAHREDPDYQHLDGFEARLAFFSRRVGRRWEIDEATYDEFLNLLPPLGYRTDSFYLCESLLDDITHRFTREGGRFFCEVARYPERPKRDPFPAVDGPKPQPD